jgi:[citrate (pro-3S)-lyase] ligase
VNEEDEPPDLWGIVPPTRKLDMLSGTCRSIADFFKMTGARNVCLYCCDKNNGLASPFVENLSDGGITITYLISDGTAQPMRDNFPEIPEISLENLGDAEPADMIITIGDDALTDAKGKINSVVKTEAVDLREILNIVWDRYFFYPKIVDRLSTVDAHFYFIQWPEAQELFLPASGSDGLMKGTLSPGNLLANYAFLSTYLYEDIQGFSMKYLKEIFSDKPNVATGKYFNVKDGQRLTVGAPEDFARTVWLFGTDVAFGVGAEDKYTIASLLQKQIAEHEGKQGAARTRVINNGVLSRSAGDRDVFEKKITPMLDSGAIKDGDIVLWIMDRRYSLGENDKKSRSYLSDYLKDHGIEIVDLAKTLRLAQKSKRVYVDRRRVNHRGNASVATKIFSDCVKNILDGNLPLPGRSKKPSFESDPELDGEQNAEFREYLGYLARERSDAPGASGAIVMNCNPFTNGHRHLVERAASEVGVLYVFVVEEDRSLFKFADRFELVRAGLSDLKNVKVLKSGKFIISTVTFPEYFTKDSAREIAIDASLDLGLFARYIAPSLGIGVRFAGSEPIDEVTRQYNRAMRETLPKNGVKFVEYERIGREGEPISASRVRALLEEKKFDEIKPLVPDITYKYLLRNFSVPQ